MIELYKPQVEDLWFKQLMLSDLETMEYNKKYGGTIDFPKEKWDQWLSSWMNNDKKYYRYLVNDETFVGEVAYYYDNYFSSYIASIIIYSKYRGKGFGKSGLNLLCDAAKKRGITDLYDNISIDNLAGISLFKKCGFIEEYRNNEYVMMKKKL